MLNTNSPIPLYHQLADILTDQIRSGKYQPGDLLPSETGMAKEYKIGRPTVRQAMDTLVRKRLVQRKRGAGTFVLPQSEQIDLFSLAGTSQAFLTQGIQTISKIIHPVGPIHVSNDQNNPFNGSDAFYFSRLTLVKTEPVLLEEIYLQIPLFNGIEKMDFENKSLSMVVSDHFFMEPETGLQSFKLSFLKKEHASFLEMKPGDPILEVERSLDFPDNPKAIFSRLYCRTDQFAFSQTITT